MKKFEFEDNIYNDVANQLQIHDECFDDRFIIELDDLTDRLPMVLTNIATEIHILMALEVLTNSLEQTCLPEKVRTRLTTDVLEK